MKHSGVRNFLIFSVLLIAFIAVGSFFDIDQDKTRAFFAQYPLYLSSIIFVFLYVVGTFFIWFGPKDVLRITSLFIFGVFWSTVLTYIGETLNMCTMFWFSRRLGRPFVAEKMGGKIKRFEGATAHMSVPSIFFLKFYPIIPFRFLDLAYGITKISFLKYAVVSMIASPVRLFVIQYFLDVMIKFGLTAAKGDPEVFMDRFMEMTYYFTNNPKIFLPLSIYVFSSIIFFIVLIIRRSIKKRTIS